MRSHRFPLAAFAVAALLTATVACSSDGTTNNAGASSNTPTVDDIRLNQLQMIGSHNSYHVAPEPAYFAKLAEAAKGLGSAASDLGDINSLVYTHAPLTTQLGRGIRSFELDVWADPAGGLFSKPIAPTFLNVTAELPTGLDQPGFKVLHIVDIDFISTCQVFIGCLREMKAWSDAHPDHVPIVILVELKDDPLPKPLDITKVVPIDATQMDALDAEIRSVLSDDQLITPDLVRGDAATLRDALNTTGWPRLGDVRGRFMFMMDNGDPKQAEYLAGHDSLKGRAIFTSADEGRPDGAVLKENDAGDGSRIQDLVKQGYFIRTRADADLVEAKANDTSNRDITLASGAQVVSTDFPPGEPDADNGYIVSLGTPLAVRCNPIAVPTGGCPNGPLEK